MKRRRKAAILRFCSEALGKPLSAATLARIAPLRFRAPLAPAAGRARGGA
ncbi:MAG: hypothetical protein WDM79_17045 [Terricaulis sp.]